MDLLQGAAARLPAGRNLVGRQRQTGGDPKETPRDVDSRLSARPRDWATSPASRRIIAAVVTRATRPVAAWALWVVVSVIGGVLGALVAWRVRALLTVPAPTLVTDALRYIATILSASFAAGAQWLLLRRYRLDVYWRAAAAVCAGPLSPRVVISTLLPPVVRPLPPRPPSR